MGDCYGSGSGENRGGHSVLLLGLLWKRQLGLPGDHLAGGAVGVSQHWCMFGYPHIQAISPEITKRKGTATVEW